MAPCGFLAQPRRFPPLVEGDPAKRQIWCLLPWFEGVWSCSIEVRPLPALLGEELAEVELDKRKCLLLRDDIQALESSVGRKSCVRLLPHFDPYLLAHREKDHLLDAKHYKRVYRNQGWISPVVLVEGSVAGTWSYRLKGKRLLVTVEPFARLSRAAGSEIAQEAGSLAGFLESAWELSI